MLYVCKLIDAMNGSVDEFLTDGHCVSWCNSSNQIVVLFVVLGGIDYPLMVFCDFNTYSVFFVCSDTVMGCWYVCFEKC